MPPLNFRFFAGIMMTRSFALLGIFLLASCATRQVAPGPLPDNPPGTPEGAAPAASLPSRPSDSAPPTAALLDSLARDTAMLVAKARDSALDAAMLDRIAAAQLSDSTLPPAAPVEGESATLRSMFDIDVANFEEHARVRFWLGFFSGPARERMAIWLQRMPRYEPGFRKKLVEQGLPGDLAYLPLIESGYSATAVSRSRAVGMWQFMRPTGKFYGLAVDAWVDERRDVAKATEAAVRYLGDLTRQFGSPYLAAAAYNGGPGRIRRGLSRLGPDDADVTAEDSTDLAEEDGSPHAGDVAFFQLADSRYIHQETKDYVPKLIAAAMIAKRPERYGFPPVPGGSLDQPDSVIVTDATGLDVVARLAGVTPAEVTGLNPVYLRAITPPKRRAIIRVPHGKGAETAAALDALPATERLSGFPHHARAGETLSGLAKKYGVPLAAMRTANSSLGKRAPRRGEVVLVPGAARLAGWVSENRKLSLAAGAAGGTHKVKRGETLGGIARKYRVSVTQLRSWNRIGPKGLIRAGQVLRLEGGSAAAKSTARSRAAATASATKEAGSASRARTHLVKTGETLSSLARRYGVTVQMLRAANNLTPNRPLPAGRRITIPS